MICMPEFTHPDEVEICHAAAEVTAQPGLELTAQPVGVDVGWRAGDIDDDVGDLVDISRAEGHQQGFELVLSWAAEVSDLAEVQDGQVLSVGQEEVAGVWVG
jgi:hypothetical protein